MPGFAAPVKHMARLRAGVLAPRDHDHAVHDHIGNPDRVLRGVLEGGLVHDRVGVEDGYVGAHAWPEHPAIGEARDLGGKRRHLADRVGQRQHFLLAHVDTEHAREGPIKPRVRPAGKLHVRVHGFAVRADAHPGLLHRQLDVRFAHREVDGFSRRVLGDQQVAQRVHGFFAHAARHFVQALAFVLLVFRLLTGRHQDAVPSAYAFHFVVVPARQPLIDRSADFGAARRVFESRHDLPRRALQILRRQALLEPGPSGNVGILVGGDIHAAVARRLDDPHLLCHSSPVDMTIHLEMQDVSRQARLLRDPNRLLDRLNAVRAFASNVAGVDATVFRRDLRERDQFVGGGKHVGRIDEPGGEAQGTVAHGLVNQLLHLVHLFRSRPSVDIAQDVFPDLATTRVGSDVDRNSLALDARKIFAQGRPVSLDAQRLQAPVEGCGGRAEDGPGRIGLARDLRRDALADFAFGLAVREQRKVRMAVEVNETGRHHQASGINHLLGGGVFKPPHVSDLAVLYRDRAFKPGTAAAVDDVAVNDHQVIERLWSPPGSQVAARARSDEDRSPAEHDGESSREPLRRSSRRE